MAKVSIVLNSYNQYTFFEKAIESAINQKFDDYEIIISENGSNDGSKEILEKYKKNHRIKILNYDENDIIGKRFNQAVKYSSGKYICFLYSDDFLDSNKLAIQIDEFEKLPDDYGVVYSDVKIINQYNQKYLKREVIKCNGWSLKHQLDNIHLKGHIDMVSPMIKKECLMKHKFLENIFAEGEGILLRIAKDYKFKYLPHTLAYFRDTKFNKGKAILQNLKFHNETLKILEKDILKTEPELIKSLNKYKFYFKQNVAWGNLRANGKVIESNKIINEIINYENIKFFNFKTLVLMSIIKLPKRLIEYINFLFDKFFNVKTNNIFIENYGGRDK